MPAFSGNICHTVALCSSSALTLPPAALSPQPCGSSWPNYSAEINLTVLPVGQILNPEEIEKYVAEIEKEKEENEKKKQKKVSG